MREEESVIMAIVDPGVGLFLALGAPYVAWEPLIGPWLIVKGVRRNG